MGTDPRGEKFHYLPRIFLGAQKGAPDTGGEKDAVLFKENSVPHLRTSRFQGHEILQRKDNSFPRGGPSTSPSSVALPHLVRRTYSPCPGWGILPHPLSSQRDKHEHVFAFGRRLASERISPIPLGPTDPCFQLLFHMEPFSSFSPQGSHLIFATTTKISPVRLQAGSAGTFTHAEPATLYSLRRNLLRGKLCRAPV
ncbi:hypothetical protein JTE90_000957 [Oedothorax gibbosus]|uniref:Uncharacterized protein n=1 Tax=Oedothorax gibbosus TaxID=931172 RepID=A0AAV6TJD5_9ARAC|nr:hypothetical protein JTE90_000957 [Oedothorax gibbosus]